VVRGSRFIMELKIAVGVASYRHGRTKPRGNIFSAGRPAIHR
jgi:hypothetical protein